MKIAVYSGSFNPLHIGHLAVMRHLTCESEFDMVYLVVSPQNPLKDESNRLTALERYEAAVEAVKRHPELRVKVDDIELRLDPPQYTVKTLDALKRREPQNEFTLVIGADNLGGIHHWRDFRRLLSEYGVVVYPRKGTDLSELRRQLLAECVSKPVPYVLDPAGSYPDGAAINLEEDSANLYHITLLDSQQVDVSSTQLREAQARGEDVSGLLM